MEFKRIVHDSYTVVLEKPEIYVDNEKRKRSGHMTHAMAEFEPNCFIDFNSNCSPTRCVGHSTFGWVEYRISHDGGVTYSDVSTLPISTDYFYDGLFTISVEKAVAVNGKIIAFCLVNTLNGLTCCEPWQEPLVITSEDEGKTWSAPYQMCSHKGRIYDAFSHDGEIYVLHFCNEQFIGKKTEDVYRLYKSTNGGESFEEAAVIPFDTVGRGYGSILMDKDGILHAYAYNLNAECKMDHAVSRDKGKTWENLAPCHLAKGIRNPQTALIDGVYILHGRAGDLEGFVLYTSTDATHWDEGTMVVEKKGAYAYYSNNLNLKDEKGNFLLVQYSDAFDNVARVNVMHMKVRVEK